MEEKEQTEQRTPRQHGAAHRDDPATGAGRQLPHRQAPVHLRRRIRVSSMLRGGDDDLYRESAKDGNEETRGFNIFIRRRECMFDVSRNNITTRIISIIKMTPGS